VKANATESQSMSLLSRLFGSKPAPEAEPEIYKEFAIFAEPAKESGGYRIRARIEKEIDGQTKTHVLIRADTIADLEKACEASSAKAKQIIDEQGDRLFS
jgi:hypothetical protein